MFIDEIIQQLEKEIKILFHKENSGHDIYHLRRTLNNALKLQEKEGGDELVIAVSAFLHDVHRIIQKETGEFCSPKNSLPKVKQILDKTNLTKKQKEKILHCIKYHEEYNFSENGKTTNNIETLILQDADNLDAIGAIGITRGFSYAGSRSIPIWNPDLPFDRDIFDESKHDPSEIHHFYSKLLKLKENMNTETAKKKWPRKDTNLWNYFFKNFLMSGKGKSNG